MSTSLEKVANEGGISFSPPQKYYKRANIQGHRPPPSLFFQDSVSQTPFFSTLPYREGPFPPSVRPTMPFVVSIEYNATAVAGEGLLYDGQALKVTRPIDGGPLLFFARRVRADIYKTQHCLYYIRLLYKP